MDRLLESNMMKFSAVLKPFMTAGGKRFGYVRIKDPKGVLGSHFPNPDSLESWKNIVFEIGDIDIMFNRKHENVPCFSLVDNVGMLKSCNRFKPESLEPFTTGERCMDRLVSFLSWAFLCSTKPSLEGYSFSIVNGSEELSWPSMKTVRTCGKVRIANRQGQSFEVPFLCIGEEVVVRHFLEEMGEVITRNGNRDFEWEWLLYKGLLWFFVDGVRVWDRTGNMDMIRKYRDRCVEIEKGKES